MANYRGIAISDFLTIEEISLILDFAKNTESWERSTIDPFWDNRLIRAQDIYDQYDKQLGLLMFDLRNRTAEKIKEAYRLNEVYADMTTLVRWFPGQEQTLHADDMTNLEGHEHFNHREFGSIIYLNNNYSGGNTYYSQHDIQIVPEPGMLAVHPGDTEHFHGVTKVEGNIRYTIASFWTTNKQYHDHWEV